MFTLSFRLRLTHVWARVFAGTGPSLKAPHPPETRFPAPRYPKEGAVLLKIQRTETSQLRMNNVRLGNISDRRAENRDFCRDRFH